MYLYCHIPTFRNILQTVHITVGIFLLRMHCVHVHVEGLVCLPWICFAISRHNYQYLCHTLIPQTVSILVVEVNHALVTGVDTRIKYAVVCLCVCVFHRCQLSRFWRSCPTSRPTENLVNDLSRYREQLLYCTALLATIWPWNQLIFFQILLNS